MQVFPFEETPHAAEALGLIALQTDARIETDMRRLLPMDVPFFVSRVPSDAEVTRETLAQMEAHLSGSAALLPPSEQFGAIGYGCTSGSAQIGPDVVARRVQDGAHTRHVTNPVSALLAACQALGIQSLALLSPYVQSVSNRLRDVLAEHDVQTPVFGSFDVAQEARVIKITPGSIIDATRDLYQPGQTDAVFLSCTNLNTLDAVIELEQALGCPVLSSNLVLAWHMAQLGGHQIAFDCRLTQSCPTNSGSAQA